MSEIIKEYSNEDLSVVWKPKQCIHSEKCFHGLSSVFNPNNRPWVNISGATSQEIKNQVDKCPSGALSYKLKNLSLDESDDHNTNESVVEVLKDGPLMLFGDANVKHHDGTEAQKKKATAFCRCGASDKKPYCDGSHKKVEFKG